MKINTTPGETYIVLSTGGCTVTTGAGKQIKKLAAGQDFFTAMTGDSILSDDNASVTVAKGEILSMLNTDGTGAEVQATLRFQPVTSQSALPATGENGVIYLVPNGKPAPNQYTEWVWTGAAYEQLGDVSVDLSGYASKKDLGITNIAEEASGQMIFADSYLITKHVGVSTLGVGGCTFSGSTAGSNVVTTTGSLSAGTLGGYDVVTTGGAVVTNYIKVVSEAPTLEYADMTMGAEIRGYKFTDEYGYQQNAIEISAGAVRLTTPSGAWPDLKAPILRTTAIYPLEDGGAFWVGNRTLVGGNYVKLGGYESWDLGGGINYMHYNASETKMDILTFGKKSMLDLGYHGELRCGNGDEGISMYTNDSGIATLRIGSKAEVIGLSGSDGSSVSSLAESLLVSSSNSWGTEQIFIGRGSVEDMNGTGMPVLIATSNSYSDYSPHRVELAGYQLTVYGSRLLVSEENAKLELTNMASLVLGDGSVIKGPGWDTIVANIRAGAGGDGTLDTLKVGELNVNNIKFTNDKGSYDGGGISFNQSNLTEINSLGANAVYTSKIQVDGYLNRRLLIGTPEGEETDVLALYLGDGVQITGPGWDAMVQQIQAGSSGSTGGGSGSTGDNNQVDTLYVNTVYPLSSGELTIEAYVTGVHSLGVKDDIYVGQQITAAYGNVRLGKAPTGSEADGLYLGPGMHITGPGWEEMQAAAAATTAESEQPSFTKLIFPPAGTATAEQDPSWITKSHILMETNGGQLNMTQLTATLAYAAQTPLSIAKRTLWLSTSPGTGDAVQWPANAVFPDDQPQDKIQQLNSNSTYWFDITYVGGSDTVLIRKVCSWASTTGESGPTE